MPKCLSGLPPPDEFDPGSQGLDEWRDTVDTMIDRGANVPMDQVETLVKYLAKNFAPKPETPDAAPLQGDLPLRRPNSSRV